MPILLNFGYHFHFHGVSVELYLDKVFYGSGYISNGFIVLDNDHDTSSINDHRCFSLIASSNDSGSKK